MIRIFDIEYWNEIFQSIGRNRRRSIFTALGVVWGTFMLVLLLGVGIGLSDITVGEMADNASNSLFLYSSQTSVPYKGMKSGRWWNIRYGDVEEMADLPEVKIAGALGPTRNFKLIHGSTAYDSYTAAYDLGMQEIDGISAYEGRIFNSIDIRERRKVCLVPKSMADRIGGGSPITGENVKLGNTYFTVVGTYIKTNQMFVMSDPDRTVLIPYTTDNYLFNSGSLYVNMIAITGKDNADLDSIEDKCRMILSRNHLVSPDDDKAIETFNARELLNKIKGLFSGIIFLTWFVGGGTLIAGIIGISNIMLIIVRERRQEIGIRRALGASPKEIIGQIIAESSVLSLTAGIIGMTAAVLTQGVLDRTLLPVILQDLGNMPHGYTFQLPFGTALAAFGLILAGSLAAGILPAYKALTINTVDALREE